MTTHADMASFPIFAKLAAAGCELSEVSDGWQGHCPAHDDHDPSLHVEIGHSGAVVMCCRGGTAGCSFADIIRAVGGLASDCYPRRTAAGGNTNSNSKAKSKSKIVATYDYHDEQGRLLFQVVRFEPKDFRQRKPDGNGGWTWSVKDVRRVPYRLPELLKVNADAVVFIAEGEKDCDKLVKLGHVATTNAGGAGKWDASFAEFFQGRRVVILPDNDDVGRDHAKKVAGSLIGKSASVRVVELPGLPPKGDVSDWLNTGGTSDGLLMLVDAAAESTSAEPSGVELRVITSAEFSATSYRRHFLVRRVLAEGQCCMIGGPKKALKTSIIVDLALSLGTGTPFLNHPDFVVPEIVPAAVLSGESGGYTLQETARRIALSRGRLLTSAQVFWGFELPKLARQDHLDALAKMIRDNGVKVCFVDPAYLCLMGGPSEANLASNVFAMGSLLSGLSDVGRDTESTIVLVHHTRKQDRMKPFEVPELDDLAFAGFGEWARQWLLLNRRERYDGESGEHRLWLNIGGSAGHSGTWALDIREGTVIDDRSERTWAASVMKAADVIERNQQEREQRRDQKKCDEHQRDVGKVLSVLGATPLAQSVIRDRAKLSTGRTKTAINRLLESGKARHEEYVAHHRTFLGVSLSEASGIPGSSGIPDGIPDGSIIRDASLSLERRSIPDGSVASPIEAETAQHPGWSAASNEDEGELEWVA